MDEWLDRWTDEQTNEQADRQMSRQIDGCMYVWVYVCGQYLMLQTHKKNVSTFILVPVAESFVSLIFFKPRSLLSYCFIVCVSMMCSHVG